MQQDYPTTIQATVNTRLLSKAQRLFTGTLHGRIIEILQNARRAGATEVKITNDNGQVTVTDNGKGITDFSELLDLGGSGWTEDALCPFRGFKIPVPEGAGAGNRDGEAGLSGPRR